MLNVRRGHSTVCVTQVHICPDWVPLVVEFHSPLDDWWFSNVTTM